MTGALTSTGGRHRSGVNQEAIIAEDDADYTQYRIAIEVAEQAGQSANGTGTHVQVVNSISASFPEVASTPSLPTLDEVLASFRTPSTAAGEEVEWPEDQMSVAELLDHRVPDYSTAATEEMHFLRLNFLPRLRRGLRTADTVNATDAVSAASVRTRTAECA